MSEKREPKGGRVAPVATELSSARRRRARLSAGGVTAEAVALEAGVSTASVSRVLNNKKVDAELSVRVREAAARLGYQPHAAARTLASHRSHTIGAVVPTIANPNFAIGVEALQSRLGGDGYKLLLASSNYDANLEEQQVGSLLAHGVDGVMLVGGAHNQNLINLLRSKNVPFVCSWASDVVLPSVGFDNYASARLLANYLMDLGHRDIGVIAGITRGNDRAAARVAGIRDALRERQLALPRERLTECSYRIVDGQIGLGGLLAQDPWPTAVICGNDVLAFGVLVECQKRGIHVPTQLSVASFDDLEFAAQLNPPLTTLRIPAAEIGARAAEYLMALIAGTVVPLTVDVSVNLIVRGSTAPPRQGRRR